MNNIIFIIIDYRFTRYNFNFHKICVKICNKWKKYIMINVILYNYIWVNEKWTYHKRHAFWPFRSRAHYSTIAPLSWLFGHVLTLIWCTSCQHVIDESWRRVLAWLCLQLQGVYLSLLAGSCYRPWMIVLHAFSYFLLQ